MLYLVRTFGRNKKTGLKVGFTDNMGKRIKQYKTDNPFLELITTRQGTKEDETKMHLYLTALKLKEKYLVEWFLDKPETMAEFHVKAAKRDRVIWNMRDELFSPSDFARGNVKLKIYEELRLQHNGEIMKKNIDWEWKKDSNREILKKMRSLQNP